LSNLPARRSEIYTVVNYDHFKLKNHIEGELFEGASARNGNSPVTLNQRVDFEFEYLRGNAKKQIRLKVPLLGQEE